MSTPGWTHAHRLHTSENAYGASPAATRAIAAELHDINRYPDNSNTELIAAIANFHGVSAERIIAGNGVDEVILLLVLALADDTRPAVVTGATFTSYRESMCAARQPFTTSELCDYGTPVPELAAKLRAGAPFAFVCTPHNPTGAVLDAAALAELRAAAVDGGGVLIVDEAYGEYAGKEFVSSLGVAGRGGNVCVLKTFSKVYGLAGLRIGYVVGDPEVIARANGIQRALPYHVNRMAQRAAVAALSDQGFVRQTVRRVARTREQFRLGLAELGLHSLPSHGNFVLLPLDTDSGPVTAALWERGFAVRDTTDMGLPHHIRVSIGTPDQMTALLAELASLLALR